MRKQLSFTLVACVLLHSIFVAAQAPTPTVVILVHTSSAGGASIAAYRGGSYYTSIARPAAQKGYTVEAFQWLTPDMPQLQAYHTDKRILGAMGLARRVIDLKAEGKDVIIVGHSYGGQVVSGASALLAGESGRYSKQHPISVDWAAGKEDFNAINAFLDQGYKSIADYKARKFPKGAPQYLIKKMYLLVTPVDNFVLKPSSLVTEHIVNIYSMGDVIVPAAGSRLVALNDRVTNLRIVLGNGDPIHAEVTSNAVLGWWLLDIPEVLKERRINGFENFNYGTNGIITFAQRSVPVDASEVPALSRPPTYQVDTSPWSQRWQTNPLSVAREAFDQAAGRIAPLKKVGEAVEKSWVGKQAAKVKRWW